MDLRQRRTEEMKISMKAKDAVKTSAIRMLLALPGLRPVGMSPG